MGVLLIAIADGLNPRRVAATKGGEYHSPCPGCGGKDRFIIWNKLDRYFCRQCKKAGDEIQYKRDFHGLTYKEACEKNGMVPKEKKTLLNNKNIALYEPKIVQEPALEWKKQAFSFIQYCKDQLNKTPYALELLKGRRLSKEFIDRFHLGWNPKTVWLNRSDWGMEAGEKKLWVPKGLLIPTYDSTFNNPSKLKVRRSEWVAGDKLPKYVEISGSAQRPSIYGCEIGKPIIVVESELDAILLQQCARDLCCSLALGGASKRPDSKTHSLLVNAPVIFFSLDVDSAGAMAYRWWKQTYPKIRLLLPPIGKSPGDALIAGIDLRKWISSELCDGLREDL